MQLPSYLSPDDLTNLIRRAIQEDVGPGDVTTEATVNSDQTGSASIRAKAPGVIAGLAVAERVFAHVDPAILCRWQVADGTVVEPGVEIGTIEGPARGLLIAERLALNVLQRMSGIATATRRMVEAASPHTPDILDTRKTVPGLRGLDKWAVKLGGGTNHRVGLYDLILIKDNHIAAAGGIHEALDAAKVYCEANEREDLDIEIETRTLEEVSAVVEHGGANIILLDNMAQARSDGSVDVAMLEEAIAIVDGTCRTEASGNVTRDTVNAIAATGVDAISSGALTHSVTVLDLSMQMTVRS
ncbi:nicotinate-nucleotide diphosphorylase (carboxylating) [Longibacter salinarum]|uniref:nicotinate-nucleotide diphosphorylase (carboxylating) n=1 Tax=Longibacter salinarum TaxID=1850348 RepID=A0A2A8CXE3_9BACT|nr:carboxylating nicotinate-nucleotide diphosphorylase [Longibacter salinarum]PEN13409.1 nicotinate-nucleotide diphosphorylase (carboxylating) [Longibacter salinarum]